MNKSIMVSLALAVSLSVVGCAKHTPKPQHASVSASTFGFEIGKTTKSDVIAKLGTPTSHRIFEDGTQKLLYKKTTATGSVETNMFEIENGVLKRFENFETEG